MLQNQTHFIIFIWFLCRSRQSYLVYPNTAELCILVLQNQPYFMLCPFLAHSPAIYLTIFDRLKRCLRQILNSQSLSVLLWGEQWQSSAFHKRLQCTASLPLFDAEYSISMRDSWNRPLARSRSRVCYHIDICTAETESSVPVELHNPSRLDGPDGIEQQPWWGEIDENKLPLLLDVWSDNKAWKQGQAIRTYAIP